MAAVKDHVRDAGWETVVEQFGRDIHTRGAASSQPHVRRDDRLDARGRSRGRDGRVHRLRRRTCCGLSPFATRTACYELYWRAQEAAGHTFRWRDYEDVRSRRDLFDSAVVDDSRFLSSNGTTFAAAFVSGNYFEALGAPVLLGRGLAEYDALAPGAAPVAVLSHQAWTRFFKQDPGIIGREVVLNDRRLVVVGVTRAEFQGVDDAPHDLWVPVTMYGAVTGQDRSGRSRRGSCASSSRLRPGVTPAQAQASLGLAPSKHASSAASMRFGRSCRSTRRECR